MEFYSSLMKCKQVLDVQENGLQHNISMLLQILWPLLKGLLQDYHFHATVASKELMKQWPLGSHGTTFGGNPIACSVALNNLEIFHEEKLVENSKSIGNYARQQLLKLKEQYPIISDVRSAGLMIGIEISNLKTGETRWRGSEKDS